MRSCEEAAEGAQMGKISNFDFELVILYWSVLTCRHGKTHYFLENPIFSCLLHYGLVKFFTWQYWSDSLDIKYTLQYQTWGFHTYRCTFYSYLKKNIFITLRKIDYRQVDLTVFNISLYRDSSGNIIHFLHASCNHKS